MNTRPVIDESEGPISLSVAFNQDSSCFVVGLDSGFCVFNSEPCELKVSRDFNAGIGLGAMLGRANYIAIVGGGRQPKFAQNKVIIWDDAHQKAVITLDFRSNVQRVKLSKTRIVVALLNSIHIFKFTLPSEKLSVFETADNPLGLSCLGSKLIAFPGRTPGQVQMVEIETGNVSILLAHSSPLKAMDLSPNGEILATASEQGTLIRVFSTANCARIAELRRGVDPAIIYSLSISPSSTLLAVTSDKSTLHVFDLPATSHSRAGSMNSNRPHRNSNGFHTNGDPEETNSHKWGILGKLPLMPRLFSDIYSFSSAHFETDDSPLTDLGTRNTSPIPGIPGGKPMKGIVGWTDDATILVIGAGRDGRWERFVIGETNEGKRQLIRNGWKRYLGS